MRQPVPPEKKVLSIHVSDLHLRHHPPVWRSVEPDWYAAQKRVCDWLFEVHIRNNQAPVVLAGDLFHHWKSNPELVNFALRALPHLYAIPGNHDLPLHNYADLHKSAFWTMVEAWKVTEIKPGQSLPLDGGLVLHGFPCGVPCRPYRGGSLEPFGFRMAVVHDYVWKKDCGYEGAKQSSRVGSWLKRLEGFRFAHFGDNHRGFVWKNIINAGALMRTKSDEKDYRPFAALLHKDGSITKEHMDTTKDKYLPSARIAKVAKEQGLDASLFFKELNSLEVADEMDFHDAVKKYMEAQNVPAKVRRAVLEIIPNGN